jgi:hypothetical protein
MTALAEMIARNTTAAVMFTDQKAAEDTLAGLDSNPNVISAQVVMSSGMVLAVYRGPHQDGADTPVSSKTLADIIREARTEPFAAAWETDDDLAVAAIILDGQEIGVVVVRSDLRAAGADLTGLITVAGVFIAAAAIAISWP